MNQTILYTLACALLLSTVSCKKWLDIQPESEVDRSVLFSTEQGFREALLGIYTRGAKSDLYGRELTIGTPEVLAQNYQMAAHDPHKYLRTKNFEYDDPDFIRRKDGIWKGLFHAIVNCNLILEQIDQKQHLFTQDDYPLIKGETLALRAYFHLDALRLFAPSYRSAPMAEAIPYVTTYSNQVTRMQSVSAVLDSVIQDLERAKELLVTVDPITAPAYIIGYPNQSDTTLNTETTDPRLFLQNRRHRMNYYAVLGTLARAYLYKDDPANALLNARAVIDANRFPWTNPTDFLAVDADKKDRILYKEIIFGWYIPSMNSAYNSNWFSSVTSGMHLSQEEARTIYETSGPGGNDMRYTQWFTTTSVNNTFISEIHKYRRNSLGDSDNANLHYMMAPAIRLSEMYYIAAEASYATNPEDAATYLDAVRIHRGIGLPTSVTNETAFRQEILKEYRKELFAEGQLFYAYKRLNNDIAGQNGVTIPASNAIFVLPLPDDEMIYGKR